MTHAELKEKADHGRMMFFPKKSFFSGIVENVVFDDIIHYFNGRNIEIGYVTFPHTKHEQVHLFPEGREWNPELLSKTVVIRRNRK